MEITGNHFKESLPEETVQNLLEILRSLNIETQEVVPYKSKINTNSLRVVFKGTNIGTNGKGVNEAYCRASAYAEFFERFQNNYLNPYPRNNDDDEYDFKQFPDEVYLTSEELVNQDDPFLNHFFEEQGLSSACFEKKVELFASINVPDKNDRYLCLPFYNVSRKTVQYLPARLLYLAYGTNGMVAGNTFAEAVVQGLSEIVERIVQKELIVNPQSLPTVPDEYIKNFRYVYDIYLKAKELKGYKVIMKDCSLGGKYPVAGLLIIEEGTGRFGLKLGSHPNFGVAMERTLTEATQGGDLTDYAQRSFVDFTNRTVVNKNNIMNSFATGLAQYPYQVLIDDQYSKFVECNSHSDKNHDFMNELFNTFSSESYEILIRDNSWLGFPSYHIVIPGLSEVNDLSERSIRLHNTIKFVMNLFKEPEKISENDCRYIIATINQFKGNVLLDNMKYFFPYSFQELPYGNGPLSTRYLVALCDVYCGNIQGAVEKFKIPQGANLFNTISELDKKRYTAEIIYLSSLLELGTHDKAMAYMKLLLSPEMYKLIDDIYREPKKILSNVYSKYASVNENKESKLMTRINYILREHMSKANIQQVEIGEKI